MKEHYKRILAFTLTDKANDLDMTLIWNKDFECYANIHVIRILTV